MRSGSFIVRAAAGRLAIRALETLARLPGPVVAVLGAPLLPLYAAFRPALRAKLRALSPSTLSPSTLSASLLRSVSALAYYRMRLRLAHRSARQALGFPDDRPPEIVGGELFADALSSGRPVVLLGWHQGPVESLHRVPASACAARAATGTGGFFLLTAGAFAPALSAWMTSLRARDGVRVLRPGDRAGLRDWARGGGVLAVMVDQVPGNPKEWEAREDRLELFGGAVALPWPARLLAWIEVRDPVRLVVSVRLEADDRIVFRYDRPEARGATKDAVARLMEDALARAPEQYNWSYGKCRVAAR